MHGYLLVKEYLISKGFNLTTPSNIKRTVLRVATSTNSLLHLRERLIWALHSLQNELKKVQEFSRHLWNYLIAELHPHTQQAFAWLQIHLNDEENLRKGMLLPMEGMNIFYAISPYLT